MAELSGSESLIHFTMDNGTWVSQSHGIHPFEVGTSAQLYADMSKAMVFDAQGRRIAA